MPRAGITYRAARRNFYAAQRKLFRGRTITWSDIQAYFKELARREAQLNAKSR